MSITDRAVTIARMLAAEPALLAAVVAALRSQAFSAPLLAPSIHTAGVGHMPAPPVPEVMAAPEVTTVSAEAEVPEVPEVMAVPM